MGIKRTKHAVYDLKYHLAWIPKYRKHVFDKRVSDHVKSIFNKIAEEYEFRIDMIEVMEDHVHVFVEAPPGHSAARVLEIMRSVSAREMLSEFPELRKQLRAGELCDDGYFVRSVGDKVTSGIIRRYIEYQARRDDSGQPNVFDNSPWGASWLAGGLVTP